MIASTKSTRRVHSCRGIASPPADEAKAMRDRYLPPDELSANAVAALPVVMRHSPDLAETLAVLAVDPQVVDFFGGVAGVQLVFGLAIKGLTA